MSKKSKPRVKSTSCGAIVYRVEPDQSISILLIKQFEHKETWGIPKGHIDPDERIESCAWREVFEETGIDVVLGERLPDCFAHMKNEDKTVVAFLATASDPNIDLNCDGPESDVADAKWTPITKLPPLVTYQQTMIAAAIELLKIRLHGPKTS